MNTTERARIRWVAVGLGRRAGATVIDALVLFLVSAPLMWLAYGDAIARLDDKRPLSLAINWLLPVLGTLLCWHVIGATPGKWLLSIRVVQADTHETPTWAQCLLRAAGYALSLAPLGLGFLWIAIDSDHRAWHDTIARTRVMRAERPMPASVRRNSGASRGPRRGYLATHWNG